ncbi:hypothetical protein ACH5AU_08825 [Streptomyces albidoflavus]
MGPTAVTPQRPDEGESGAGTPARAASTAHRQALADATAQMLDGMDQVIAGFDQPELDTIARWLTRTVSVVRDATLALAAENRDRQAVRP